MDFSADNKKIPDYVVPFAAASVVNYSAAKLIPVFSKNLNETELNEVNSAINKVCSKINNLTNSYIDIFHIDKNNCHKMTKLPDCIESIFNPLISFSKGQNAGYNFSNNIVCLNRKKVPLTAFHELGHAYNNNISKYFKHIGFINYVLTFLAPVTMFLPAFLKKTPENIANKEEKIKNKIIDAAPYLASGLFLPVVAEEGLASLRAGKFAKNLLSPGLYRKMVGGNICGFVSYLSAMVIFGLGAKILSDN